MRVRGKAEVKVRARVGRTSRPELVISETSLCMTGMLALDGRVEPRACLGLGLGLGLRVRVGLGLG